ncbi:GNAT family N-acetyltransferase [Pseudoalteromonas pernae]|uniref:GNAT family N-acetyltransferase n=1 Tax=Pseudoalteromonas pernae TaxID=3118054 RepID=UPI0032425EDC
MFMNVEAKSDLQLRLINHKDAQAIFDLLSLAQVAQFNDYLMPREKADARELIQGDIEMQFEQTGCRLGIILHTKLIGTVGLYNIHEGVAELGFELHPDFWGLGYMQCAVKILMSTYHQYVDTDLVSLNARVHEQNRRCGRTLRSLGFIQTSNTQWTKSL